MLDLVIIGAGFSGLQAAVTAQKAGLSIAILEARDRVGGKSWTVPLKNANGKADLGAAWVNDELQPLVWSYIQQFGLEDQIVKQRLGHKAVMVSANGERIEFPFGITPDVSYERHGASWKPGECVLIGIVYA
jgi:monoamine oxidase